MTADVNESKNEAATAAIDPVLQGRAAALVDADTSWSTELVQLRIRVIALENLVIALLAQAPEAQLQMVCEMANYISPRAGHTPHPLTLHAADEMRSLMARATQFRPAPAAEDAVTAGSPQR
jgi:hypothetical protein